MRSGWLAMNARPVKVHADKGYDSKSNREALRKRGIIPRITRRGVENSRDQSEAGKAQVGMSVNEAGVSARSPGSTASAGWLFVMSDGWTFITLSFDLAAPSSVGATWKRRFVKRS